jgi:hypothetical protein
VFVGTNENLRCRDQAECRAVSGDGGAQRASRNFRFAKVGARPPVLVLSNTGGGPLRQRQCGEQPHDARPPDGGEQCVKGRYRMAATSP